MRLLAFAISCLVLLDILVGTTNPENEDFEEDDFESSNILDDATTSQEEDDTPDEPPSFLERPLYKPPVASGNVFLAEAFESQEAFKSRWIKSRARKDGVDDSVAKYDGEWSVEEAKENSLLGDLGLVLQNLAKHHAISVKLEKPFLFDGKPLIVQYEVKFQNGQECGGAYIKLLTQETNLDLAKFHDKTQYTIMFGPDKCGNDHKLHFIFQHKNPRTGKFEEKHAKRPSQKFEHVFTDKKSHLYTLAVHPDNQFELYIDEDLVNSGSLLDDVTPPVNPPKEIADPNDKKPDDWDDRERIPDPDAKKPEDWDEDEPEMIPDETAEKPEGWLDDEPELIPSTEAERPSDWDDDVDGDWEPPMINNPKCDSAPGCGDWSPAEVKNPKYKGKWHAPSIDNPDYKGIWSAKMVPNPDYFEDKEPYKMSPISALGLELWSMSEDIFFDNFIITDDKAVADQWAYDTWRIKRAQELSGSGRSVVDSVMEATNERPWLWVVIILAILLPIILIAYCCMSPSQPRPDDGLRKKTDAPTEDGRYENEADEEDDEEEDDGQNEATQEKEKDSGRAENAQKPKKSDLDSEIGKEAEVESDSHEENSKIKDPVPSSSPRKRKTKARKD